MSTEMKQDLEVIEELIRTVDGYLDPGPQDDFTYLYNASWRCRV